MKIPGAYAYYAVRQGEKTRLVFLAAYFFETLDQDTINTHVHGHVYHIPNSGTPERIFASEAL